MKTFKRFFLLSAALAASISTSSGKGLAIERPGTHEAYWTHNGEPLLSFGGGPDLGLYGGGQAFDYKRWADHIAAAGMNHWRVYPPLSWRMQEMYVEKNGGDVDAVLFPYKETEDSRPGNREFDLTQFDERYWEWMREVFEYCEAKGIVIHLLCINGWQLDENDRNWGGHFFNPVNNVNAFTESLGGPPENRHRFYHSLIDGNAELLRAQQEWYRKLVQITADLDNVYYDLVHELGDRPVDSEKVKPWITLMAQTIRAEFAGLAPEQSCIIGMDCGGMDGKTHALAILPRPGSLMDWIYSHPELDLLIYGKVHQLANARSWRFHYKKPYVPQEAWDEHGPKYTLGHPYPDNNIGYRKYLWKFMMAKCQQMDVYWWQRGPNDEWWEQNYDPASLEGMFSESARLLRDFWGEIADYPNLGFQGGILHQAPIQMVLSSPVEVLCYLSSESSALNVDIPSQQAEIYDVALADGPCLIRFFDPASGFLESSTQGQIEDGRITLQIPDFTDDLMILVHTETSAN